MQNINLVIAKDVVLQKCPRLKSNQKLFKSNIEKQTAPQESTAQ